jgi:hypothetical protein
VEDLKSKSEGYLVNWGANSYRTFESFYRRTLDTDCAIVIGKGLPLFANKPDEVIFELTKTETFSTWIIQLAYQPVRK